MVFGGIFDFVVALLRGRFVGKHAELKQDTLPDNTTAGASMVKITRNAADLAISYHADQAIQFVWADSDSAADTAIAAAAYRTKGAEGEIHCRNETATTLYIRANTGTAGSIGHSRLRA